MMLKPELVIALAGSLSALVNGKSERLKIQAEEDARVRREEREHEYRMAKMGHDLKLLEFIASNNITAPEQLNAIHEFINALK